ncbi:MAG TPA: VanZ family protein [Bacteroidales bacterium]|nr:VanZ family protein [Bacteroidales bacterium]
MIKKNIFSLIIALIIIILSFLSGNTFSHLRLPRIPNLDKLVHATMYFALTLALVYENRNVLFSVKSCFYLALIPLVFGGTIEIMQSMFTTSRTGEFLDFFANAAGITCAVLLWLVIRSFRVGKIK